VLMSLSEQSNRPKQTQEETEHGPDRFFYVGEKSIISARSSFAEEQDIRMAKCDVTKVTVLTSMNQTASS
jgi:hypothetical protein